MGVALLRRAAFGSAIALSGCSLLLSDGFTSPDDPAVDAATDTSDANTIAPLVDGGTDAPIVPPDGACPAATTTTDPNLVAWFAFEEDDPTTVHDCSGHGLDAKLVVDGGFQRVAGRIGGKAIDTGGDRGCFDLGTATALAFLGTAFTVTAWIKPRAYSYPDPLGGTDPKPRWFLDRFSTAGGGWGIGTDDTAFDGGFVEIKTFQANGVFDEAESTSTLPKGAWVHVAGVYSSTAISLYVDGKLAAEKTLASPMAVDPQAHGWLGCRAGTEPSYDGVLDDVRIYSRALGVAEISALSQ